MKRTVTVAALILGVLGLALSVQVHGQKGGARQPYIPLKVTFYAFDDQNVETRMHGHSSTGGDVQYIDSGGNPPVIAHLMRDTGELWLSISSTADRHIDFDFTDQIVPGSGGLPPEFEGQQTDFRMTTIGTEGWRNFLTMPAGTQLHGLKVWFFCCGYPHNWTVGYDGIIGDDQSSFVDIKVEKDSNGNNVRWTLLPRHDPVNIKDSDGIAVYGGAQLDKYAREKPAPGYHIDYGTWVLPFKVVIERK